MAHLDDNETMSSELVRSSPLAEKTTLSIEERYTLLADPHRRCVIEHLDRSSGELEIVTLVDRIAERSDDRDRLLLTLHHNHLPRLEDYGIIEYDHHARTVSRSWS